MKKIKTPLYVFMLSSSLLFFFGCVQKEFIFTQNAICQTPIANVFFQGVHKKTGNSTTDEKEFKELLTEVIKKTGCINLVHSRDEAQYILNATYEVLLKNQSQEEILQSKSRNILKTQVVLNLSNDQSIRRDFGESTIEIEEKKILGIGESEQISKEDEIKTIQSSALAALKNFISALQSTHLQDTQK